MHPAEPQMSDIAAPRRSQAFLEAIGVEVFIADSSFGSLPVGDWALVLPDNRRTCAGENGGMERYQAPGPKTT